MYLVIAERSSLYLGNKYVEIDWCEILKIELDRKSVSASGLRFAIVTSRWNSELTSKLAVGAWEALVENGAHEDSILEFNVPGAFELPVACLKAAETGNFHAIIAIGVVIRGDTAHFDFVAGQTAAGIMNASMATGCPIMFGVLTTENYEQALVRCGEKADNKGHEAAISAIEMANELLEIESRSAEFFRDKILPNVI